MPSTKNFAYSTVLTAPSPASSGTSLVVQSADGTKFPVVPFQAVVWPAGGQPTTANAEIVTVTAISTDTFTITRAQEASSAQTVVIGDQVAAIATAGDSTQLTRAIPKSAATQDIVLTGATDFIAVDGFEVGASYGLEIPATSSLEVLNYLNASTATFPQWVGYATDTGDRSTTSTTDGTATAVAALTLSFIAVTGATYRIRAGQDTYNTGQNTNFLQIWSGPVATGTKLIDKQAGTVAGTRMSHFVEYHGTLTSGYTTLNIGMKTSAGTMHLDGSTTTSFLSVERVS